MSAVDSSAAAAGHVRGSELTVQSIFAAVLVAAFMGVSYPYMVLKIGFGPNVSIVAAFFGFIILSLIARGSYDRWQNNIVQTAGTSAAQTAFMCIVLASFDMLRASKIVHFELNPTPLETFIWLTALSGLGIFLSVPMRKHFVVDENLPFPDGIAAAETLKVLDPPRGTSKGDEAWILARRAATVLALGMLASAVFMLLREEAKMFGILPDLWSPDDLCNGVSGPGIFGTCAPDSKNPNAIHLMLGVAGVAAFAIAKMGVGVSYSLLNIGSGMIIGFRVTFWLLVGGALGWIVAPYLLVSHGILPNEPSRTDVLFWIMWPAIGMIVAAGMTILVARWRLLMEAFRGLASASSTSGDLPLSIIVVGIVALGAFIAYYQQLIFGMPIWMSLIAIVLSIPLMLVGLRALGETNWGPISALSNMMQGLFAAIAPGNVNANIMGNATTGTIAATSEGLMQDYKTGHLIGSTPAAMTIAQLIGAPIGAAALAWTYPLLVKTYGIVGENAGLAAPTARRAAGFAEVLSSGLSALPKYTLEAAGIAIVLGIIFALLEQRDSLRKWVPSSTGLSLGFLLPFAAVSTIFIGGVIGMLWMAIAPNSARIYMVPLASGFIAGEALIAVLVPILLTMGVGTP